jgi:hypothetical protein
MRRSGALRVTSGHLQRARRLMAVLTMIFHVELRMDGAVLHGDSTPHSSHAAQRLALSFTHQTVASAVRHTSLRSSVSALSAKFAQVRSVVAGIFVVRERLAIDPRGISGSASARKIGSSSFTCALCLRQEPRLYGEVELSGGPKTEKPTHRWSLFVALRTSNPKMTVKCPDTHDTWFL